MSKIDLALRDNLQLMNRHKFFEELYKKDIFIMWEDTPVIRLKLSDYEYGIEDKEHLPYMLRGRIADWSEFYDNMNREAVCETMNINNNNLYYITNWLSSRLFDLTRCNAWMVYNYLRMSRSDSEKTRVEMAIASRCLSVEDNYWIKVDGEDISWSDVNIRSLYFDSSISALFLHGRDPQGLDSIISPEYTTGGTCGKCWRRRPDGSLWLNKIGYGDDNASQVEVSISNILDRCNVDHVKYVHDKDEDKYVCSCKCMTDDSYSRVTAYEYTRYCTHNGLDFIDEILRIDPDNYHKMQIVDYLVSNSDRHSNNWGFLVDNSTMEVVKLHPLFDHNHGFSIRLMTDPDSKYHVTRRSLRESALFASQEVDFHFTSEITRDLFIEDSHYESFMKRADELGIKVIK